MQDDNQPQFAINKAGNEAVREFMYCANSFFQEDATGNAYALKRNDRLELEMVVLSHEELGRILVDAEEDLSRLAEYNMILIDSGNVHGDAWKAIFHPAQGILNFVREDDELGSVRRPTARELRRPS